MSHIEKKTEAVLAEGRRNRETWTPTLGSTPLRHYMWWREQTNKHRGQENFCHFWRVVLIWAPLLRLKMSVEKIGVVKWLQSKVDGDRLFLGFFLTFAMVSLVFTCIKIAVGIWEIFGWWSILVSPAILLGVACVVIGFFLLVFIVPSKLVDIYRARRRRRRIFVSSSSEYVRLRLTSTREMPSRLHRVGKRAGSFGYSVWDYLVLVVQVIRVKKWKICPLVEIPESVSLIK
jgi:cellulose synthase/poly-beta-1,6-N-acetylglucosamine synthase-like glycosyltransferase